MKKHTKKKIPSLRVGVIPSVLLICLVSIAVFIGMIFLAPSDYTDFYLDSCADQPLLIFLNLAPILLVAFFLYGLTARAPFSAAVTAALFLTAGAVNHYKILFRSDPFIFADLTLYKEAASILKTFDSSLFTAVICGAVIVVILLVLLAVFFRGNGLKWQARVFLPLMCLFCAVMLYFNLYTSSEVFNRFPVPGNVYNQAELYSSRGWTYTFIYDIHNQFEKEPANYVRTSYRERESAAAAADQFSETPKPHIIMIMSEAFSDLSENENFSFAGYRDPLKNYKKIADEAVVSGHVAVNTMGGGTARTEYEVLTGISLQSFSFSANPYTMIRKDFPNLTSHLKTIGYDTIAIHPGYGWFYNRQNVYRYFGFDSFYDIENGFEDEDDFQGGYISETATYDKIEEIAEPYLSGEAEDSAFIFCVTIQNHGGYAMKYGPLEPNFQTDLDLTENQKNLLTNYFRGIIDADEELGDFIDSLRKTEEPVVVVYWGDHYPSLEDTYERTGYGYQFTGDATDAPNGYFTPFFIWQNDAAAEMTSCEDNAEAHDLSDDSVFNAAYLGSTMLQLLEAEEISPFMTFANELRNQVPVIGWYGFGSFDGTITETLPETENEMMETYKKWSYYQMFDR